MSVKSERGSLGRCATALRGCGLAFLIIGIYAMWSSNGQASGYVALAWNAIVAGVLWFPVARTWERVEARYDAIDAEHAAWMAEH